MLERAKELNEVFTPFGFWETSSDQTTGTYKIYADHQVNLGFSFGVTTFRFVASMPPRFSRYGARSLDPTLTDEAMDSIQNGMDSRIDAITPFNPKVGYQITKEDYDKEARLRKLIELNRRGNFLMAGQGSHPLDFSVRTEKNHLIDKDLGVIERFDSETLPVEERAAAQDYKGTPTWMNFKNPLDRRFVERVRLQVMFPNWLAYESPLDYLLLEDEGVLGFKRFYPIGLNPNAEELGPLANVSVSEMRLPDGLEQGVTIMLPENPDQLREIQARFILTSAPRTIWA